jgi:D-glycero-D-manno-heptose 1,7-bisphosphate phosphatase
VLPCWPWLRSFVPAGFSMGVPAVFLDRDGVLNRTFVVDGVPHPPQTMDELALLPGVEEACALLHRERFRLIVVTNQPDIARGKQTLEGVEKLNGELRRRLPLDGVFVCPHDNQDDCDCRKPRPGLLLMGARAHGIDLVRSFMVGDRDKDIAAGRAAGCRTVYVNGGYGRAPAPPADLTVASLREAVPWIISQGNHGGMIP